MPPVASTSAIAHRALLQLAAKWPADPLRPSMQFGAAIKAASQRIFEAPPIPFDSATPSTADPVVAAARELTGASLANAQKSAEALERLLENRARQAYPITNKTLVPASYPNHYKRLQEGIDRALRGQKLDRGWFSWIRWSRA